MYIHFEYRFVPFKYLKGLYQSTNPQAPGGLNKKLTDQPGNAIFGDPQVIYSTARLT